MILPPRGLKLGMIFKGAARACKLSSLLNKAERKRGKPKKKKKSFLFTKTRFISSNTQTSYLETGIDFRAQFCKRVDGK